MINPTRRSFLAGLLAAPLIVRPGILMPVRSPRLRTVTLDVDLGGPTAAEFEAFARMIQSQAYDLLVKGPGLITSETIADSIAQIPGLQRAQISVDMAAGKAMVKLPVGPLRLCGAQIPVAPPPDKAQGAAA